MKSNISKILTDRYPITLYSFSDIWLNSKKSCLHCSKEMSSSLKLQSGKYYEQWILVNISNYLKGSSQDVNTLTNVWKNTLETNLRYILQTLQSIWEREMTWAWVPATHTWRTEIGSTLMRPCLDPRSWEEERIGLFIIIGSIIELWA